MALTTVPVELANLDGAVTVNESSADADFRIESNGLSHALFVDGGNDKVIINHTTTVSQAGVAPQFQVHGTGSATSSISATRNSNDTGGPYLILSKSRGTSTGAVTVVQDDDILGQIMFAGADGGDLAPVGASIQAFVDGTPGTNDMPGRLVFSTTADGAQAATERMRIDSSGNVGIGNPTLATGTGQMSIRVGASGLINAHSGSASSGQVMGFSQNAQYDSDDSWEAISTAEATNYYQGSGQHHFRVAASTSAGTDISWFTPMTLTDTRDLSVNGNVASSSYIDGKLATNINTHSRMAVYSSGNLDATFRAQGSNSCYLGIMAGATRLSNDASYLYFGGNTDVNGGSWSAYMKHITGDNHAKGKLKFLTCDGSLWHNVLELTNTGTDKVLTNSGDVGTISDQRLKKNIQDLTYSLETFKDLKPRTFEWINPSEHEAGTVNGFIAQELPDPYKYGHQIEKTNTIDQGEKVDNPDYDLVKDTDGEAFAGKLGQSDAMYVSIIQQLIEKVETLEAKVKALEEA